MNPILARAADIYAGHPVALPLRAMNIIHETTKERRASILKSTGATQIAAHSGVSAT